MRYPITLLSIILLVVSLPCVLSQAGDQIASGQFDFRWKIITVKGVELRYTEGWYKVKGQTDTHFTVYAPRDTGEYHSLLFLHGFSKDDYDFYLHQIGVALQGGIGVAIDYDELGSREYRLNQVSTAVKRLHAWSEIASVSLLGVSWGGKVAFETIAIKPELDIASAVLIYPYKPSVSVSQITSITSAILNLVGEVDWVRWDSEWVEDQIHQYNPEIDYKLQIYDGDEIPEADHGFFFANSPSQFNAPAVDSFIRTFHFWDWQVKGAPQPEWWNDPKIIHRDDLLTWDNL
jgi:dienelactone hydrolase